jgi:hypothetical protein
MRRDGFSYWLWRGGTQTQACLALAQRLRLEEQTQPGTAHLAQQQAASVESTQAAGAGGARPPEPAEAACWRGNTVLCAETEEFRQLARTLPCKGWFCVDIGAAHGHATECLAAACNDGGPEGGRVVGIEKGHDFYEAARVERPSLDFHKIDVLAAPQYLLQLADGADCVIVDINGVRELEALTPLLALLQRAIRPTLLVVKSRKLHESATQWLGEEPAGQSDAALRACIDSGDPVVVAPERSAYEICYDGKCVALQIDAVSCTNVIVFGLLTLLPIRFRKLLRSSS